MMKEAAQAESEGKRLSAGRSSMGDPRPPPALFCSSPQQRWSTENKFSSQIDPCKSFPHFSGRIFCWVYSLDLIKSITFPPFLLLQTPIGTAPPPLPVLSPLPPLC